MLSVDTHAYILGLLTTRSLKKYYVLWVLFLLCHIFCTSSNIKKILFIRIWKISRELMFSIFQYKHSVSPKKWKKSSSKFVMYFWLNIFSFLNAFYLLWLCLYFFCIEILLVGRYSISSLYEYVLFLSFISALLLGVPFESMLCM